VLGELNLNFSLFMMSGKSSEEAMNDYITKVKQLLEVAASKAST